jgi:uncharacterized protein YjbJ (UPF0337 family)
MNRDQLQGKWEQLKGKIRERWGKLTDDDVDVIAGQRDQLSGKIQERYGIAQEEAEKQLKSFEAECERQAKAAAADRPVKASRG